jgi:hypothetical protein
MVVDDKEEFVKRFKEADKGDFPDFSKCSRPLDMALWVLWVSEDKLGISRLTGEQIAAVIVGAQKISVNTNSIINSLNRAADKVHRYYEKDETYFEIMKPGIEYVSSLSRQDLMSAFYCEPDSKFTAKKFLKNQIFESLKGDLKIVDPYCSERTLDILSDLKNRDVKFLTRLENLRDKERGRFQRGLQDFKSENPNMEFRDYPNADIHDRYIISPDFLVILGHSIKDLGAKESFAVVLNKDASRNVVEALIENFDRRWKQSTPLP